MARGGRRQHSGRRLAYPESGPLVAVATKIPREVVAWLDSQASERGTSRSQEAGNLLVAAARAAGVRPSLSPEEIAELRAERDRLNALLAQVCENT